MEGGVHLVRLELGDQATGGLRGQRDDLDVPASGEFISQSVHRSETPGDARHRRRPRARPARSPGEPVAMPVTVDQLVDASLLPAP